MRLMLMAAMTMAGMVGTCSAEEEVGTIAGAGWVPCAEFAERYQASPASTEDYFYAWAQGYMSGVNHAARVRKNLRGISIEIQKSYIRAHCDQHPLANYAVAVQSLFDRLPSR